jgi:hypothetical protein
MDHLWHCPVSHNCIKLLTYCHTNKYDTIAWLSRSNFILKLKNIIEYTSLPGDFNWQNQKLVKIGQEIVETNGNKWEEVEYIKVLLKKSCL